jgi:hypothetical protein
VNREFLASKMDLFHRRMRATLVNAGDATARLEGRRRAVVHNTHREKFGWTSYEDSSYHEPWPLSSPYV